LPAVSGSPRTLDGVTEWLGLRWEDPRTVRLTVRDALINAGGLLSGVVAYALVDYSMGSALWEHTTDDEAIATLSIAITYLRTATEGEIVCRTQLDRRTRTNAALRSEVADDQGRLLATAVGTYAIFPRRRG
jgi:acyl-CoA thioesterase